jgi:hypothetical protein
MRYLDEIEMHPLVACLPMFGRFTPEMQELRTRLNTFGPEEVFLSVDEDGLLFDGRHTLMILRETDLEQVQCRVYPCEEVPARIRAYGMGRVHLSKSAKAYWWWPFYAARAHHHGRPKKRGNHSHFSDSSVADPFGGEKGEEEPLLAARIAEELGVDPKLVYYAKKVHEYLADRPEVRAEVEPRILSGELPLNRVACAVEGKRPYEEGTVDLEGRRNHFKYAAINFGKASDHLISGWDKMDLTHKGKLAEFLGEAMAKWPEDLREATLRSYRQAVKNQLLS